MLNKSNNITHEQYRPCSCGDQVVTDRQTDRQTDRYTREDYYNPPPMCSG